jgi:hypothetical protein
VVSFPASAKQKAEALRKQTGSASEARKSPEAAFLSKKTAKLNRQRFRSRKKSRARRLRTSATQADCLSVSLRLCGSIPAEENLVRSTILPSLRVNIEENAWF